MIRIKYIDQDKPIKKYTRCNCIYLTKQVKPYIDNLLSRREKRSIPSGNDILAV